jgi:hypothetical protein
MVTRDENDNFEYVPREMTNGDSEFECDYDTQQVCLRDPFRYWSAAVDRVMNGLLEAGVGKESATPLLALVRNGLDVQHVFESKGTICDMSYHSCDEAELCRRFTLTSPAGSVTHFVFSNITQPYHRGHELLDGFRAWHLTAYIIGVPEEPEVLMHGAAGTSRWTLPALRTVLHGGHPHHSTSNGLPDWGALRFRFGGHYRVDQPRYVEHGEIAPIKLLRSEAFDYRVHHECSDLETIGSLFPALGLGPWPDHGAVTCDDLLLTLFLIADVAPLKEWTHLNKDAARSFRGPSMWRSQEAEIEEGPDASKKRTTVMLRFSWDDEDINEQAEDWSDPQYCCPCCNACSSRMRTEL